MCNLKEIIKNRIRELNDSHADEMTHSPHAKAWGFLQRTLKHPDGQSTLDKWGGAS